MELTVSFWLLATTFAFGVVLGTALAAVVLRRPTKNADYEQRAEQTDTSAREEALFVDADTGLASRRYVEMFLTSEISRSRRIGKPVSVAVFDLDGSRALTERVGKDAVSATLAEMGQRFRSRLRDYDVIGRYSEGRLIVILPESATDQAVEAVERLHDSVESLKIRGEPVTVSTGVATCPDHASDAEGLINSAHHALNIGRASGSDNRIYCCQVTEAHNTTLNQVYLDKAA
ncbi:MAG: GGDEF domain-containing protein [Armatimonadetes bacterium]|nr:GGDEF domain-containing protein [Armatimonadota bacterium]